ncbi:MAG: oligosaccharide flippase family protein [Dehalococcoidales bacterium]|nr:oligosaccharide flippase family protein [Dehalococcoidales bacterium]
MRIEDLPFMPAKLKRFWNISLYRNASYLLIANGLCALLGFAFWAVVTRLYSTQDVGVASAIISALGMLGAISHPNLGSGLVRFLPRSGNLGDQMINSSLTITLFSSIFVAVIFILGINLWSDELAFLRENIVYFFLFVFFTAATALANITDNIFVAECRTGFVTLRAIIFNIGKLILAVILAKLLYDYGIVNAWGIMLVFSLIVSLIIFLPKVRQGYLPRPSIYWNKITEMVKFSIYNNISLLLWSLPTWIFPLLILNIKGAEANAYFYIAWTIGITIATVPSSIATSLFAEGSYDDKGLERKATSSLCLVMLILIPVATIIILFGDKLLIIFGKDYAANSYTLLQIIALTLFPLTVNQVYFSILRVQNKLKLLVIKVAFISTITLITGVILLPIIGLPGVSIGWFAGHLLIALWAMSKQHWWTLLFRQLTLLFWKKTRPGNLGNRS